MEKRDERYEEESKTGKLHFVIGWSLAEGRKGLDG